MSGSKIVLLQKDTGSLQIVPAPFENALRWRSVYEVPTQGEWPNIFIRQSVFREVDGHTHNDLGREVGGMLVGQARRTPEGDLYIVVEASLSARQVVHGPSHLTFTTGSLVDLLNRLEDELPGQQVVGWYHSHPGMSIFLSSMDVWLHSHFFPEPWHVALVIDPCADEGGFFHYAGGQRGNLHPRHYVGFHELIGEGTETVVTWGNLLCAQRATSNEPDEDGEVGEDVLT